MHSAGDDLQPDLPLVIRVAQECAMLASRAAGFAVCLNFLVWTAYSTTTLFPGPIVPMGVSSSSFGHYSEPLRIGVRIDVEDREIVKVVESGVAASRYAAKAIVKDDNWDIRFRSGVDRSTVVVERDGDVPVSTQTKRSLSVELVEAIIAQEFRWQALERLENREPDAEVGVELRVVRIRKVEVVSREPLRCAYQFEDEGDAGTTGGHLKENDKFIFYFRNNGKIAAHVYIFTLDGNGTTKLLFHSGGQKVPPDGSWHSTASETFGPNCGYYYIPTGVSGADVYKAFATSKPIDWSSVLPDVPDRNGSSLLELYTGKFLNEQGGSWSSGSIRFVTGREAPVTYDISIDALAGEASSGRSMASQNFEKTSVNKLERYIFLGQEANFDQIHLAFEKVIARSTPNDIFVFRFNGSVRVPSGGSASQDAANTVLVLPNSDKREISLELLEAWLSRLRARSRILILDSQMEPAQFSSVGRQLFAGHARKRGPNRSTFLWCTVVNSGRQFRDRMLMSVFDRSLSAESDSNRNGTLSVFEIQNAVQQTVFRESGQSRRVVTFEEGPDFDLVAVPIVAGNTGPAERSALAAPNEQRADRFVESKSDAGPLKTLGKSYALIFATNRYDNYPGLKNPLNDAEDLGNTLREDYGFEVEIKADVTRDDIWNTIYEYQNRVFAPNDQLLIFFAGHGKYIPAPYDQGYLIARDSPRSGPPGNIYVPFSRLVEEIEIIKNEHILLVLDVCNGGSLRYAASRAATNDDEYGEVSPEKHVDRTIRYRTRKFLTSGGNEYVSDGRGRNSPFAYRLLKFLREPHRAKDDGLITYLEIASDMNKIPNQTPQAGDLYGNIPGSDFLFQIKRR